MLRYRELRIAIVILVASGGATSRQAQANPRVDSIFAAFAKHDSPGCAVSVVDSGRTVFAKGYGMASLEHDVPITPSSAFYAASVSKQFTAFAVAMLVQQGKLSLDDDIRKSIPEMPNFGKTITVRNLIHHTSGLRDYFGLLLMTGWPMDGPVTDARFLDLVSRQKALNFDPGSRHLYSNTGYVLLSILVKRVSGKSLREYADTTIFGPLGMSNSHFRDDHTALVKHRALAYSPSGDTWRMDVPGFDVVGDGGLFTTADDMAKWARNFDDHTIGGDEVAARVLTRGRLTSGDSISYAFGLFHGVYRGQPIIEHGGAYGGYRTQLLRFPAQHFAVVTLCNASTADASRLSQSVADVYLGERLAPVTVAAASGSPSAGTSAIRLSREQLARYAGAYWDGKNETLRRIEVRDSTLAIPDASVVLVPVSETTFRVSGVNFTLAFAAGHDGSVVLEETGPGGDKATYRRVRPPKIDARTLAGFAGDYVSDELNVTWRIEPRGGNLVIRLSGVPDVTLQPAFSDTFSSPAGVVRFVRSSGKVTGLVVGAGRVTGFSFRKASRD